MPNPLIGILIQINGSQTSPVPANGKRFTLQEAQELVGGYITIVHLKDGRRLVVDEDGYSKGLLVNERAGREVHRIGTVKPVSVHPVVGPALFVIKGGI